MAVVNPVKKLMSWWRGPTDPDTVASEAERQRLQADRQTIKISQNTAAKGTTGSLIDVPTPEVLDPRSKDSHSAG